MRGSERDFQRRLSTGHCLRFGVSVALWISVWQMNPNAIEQAKIRLQRAEKALAELRAAEYFDDAESAWSDFLLASSGIYSKLEQGAKGYPKSEPWFGAEKNLRKTDPLLRYIHFARNAEEHGIERVTDRSMDNWNLKFNERRPLQMQRLNKETEEPEGDLVDAVLAGPTLKVVRVYDRRFGDFADPPETHLGKIIPFGSSFPDEVAAAAIVYLRSMIECAEKLPT